MTRFKNDLIVEREFRMNGFALHISRQPNDGRALQIAAPLTYVEISPDSIRERIAPTMYLSQTDAQQLADELWRAGIRPSEGAGSAGAMSAMQEHLKDLRVIAMGALKKEGILS